MTTNLSYWELLDAVYFAGRNNPNGFTLNLSTMQAPTKGWSVAMLRTQNSFGYEGLEHVVKCALEGTGIVGGWYEKGKYYWDEVLIVEDKESALRIAEEQEQIAIFNLETHELVYLKEQKAA